MELTPESMKILKDIYAAQQQGYQFGWAPLSAAAELDGAGLILSNDTKDDTGTYCQAQLTPQGLDAVETASVPAPVPAPAAPAPVDETTKKRRGRPKGSQPVVIEAPADPGPSVEAQRRQLVEEGQKAIAMNYPVFKVGDTSNRAHGFGARISKFPFATLDLGDAFFVPASETMPNPAKSLAVTVNAANRMHATIVGERLVKRKGIDCKMPAYEYSKKFIVFSVSKGDKVGDFVATADGALVSRIDPKS